jgi:hypothetical protein
MKRLPLPILPTTQKGVLMAFGIIVVLAGLAFYAFIGTAQDEVIKLGLTLFWVALIILSIVAEFLY